MRQDDPNQPDGGNAPQHDAPGPNAPPARPPLDKAKFPPAEAGAPPSRPPVRLRKRHAILPAVAVVIAIVVVIVANSGSSEPKPPPPPPPPQGGATYSVSVSLAGSGSGEISGSGIACPSTCSTKYGNETTATLTASPSSGSTFRGWGGACSGNEACNLKVSSPVTVTASFIKTPAYTKAYPPTEMTFERSQDYNIDHLPIRRGSFGDPEQNGFSMDIYGSGNGYVTHFEVDGEYGSTLASWTGQGEPNLSDCKQALDGSGLRELRLLHQGEWFCAQTDKHYIALIRYDGKQGEYAETFKIFAKVYKPGP